MTFKNPLEERDRLARVQSRRKVSIALLILLGVPFCALTASVHETTSDAHLTIQIAGIAAIVVCILGRTWTSLYISGRKTEKLVTEGPYSVVRNPLYLFSIVGAIGAGAQFGSVLYGVIFGAVVWAIFHRVILHEEGALRRQFGLSFVTYVTRVPRLLPAPSLWRDPPDLVIVPRLVRRTFVDAVLFLLAVPAAELFQVLQNSGLIRILYRLP